MFAAISHVRNASTGHATEPRGMATPIEAPSDPRYPIERQFAVMVNGTSINRVAQEGDILVVCMAVFPLSARSAAAERSIAREGALLGGYGQGTVFSVKY
jgi:hypothetical protein